jgi:hypothetical protein
MSNSVRNTTIPWRKRTPLPSLIRAAMAHSWNSACCFAPSLKVYGHPRNQTFCKISGPAFRAPSKCPYCSTFSSWRLVIFERPGMD